MARSEKKLGSRKRAGGRKGVKLKSAALITLDKPGAWTKSGRNRIAKWMRDRASDLEDMGELFTDTGPMRMRYMVEA